MKFVGVTAILEMCVWGGTNTDGQCILISRKCKLYAFVYVLWLLKKKKKSILLQLHKLTKRKRGRQAGKPASQPWGVSTNLLVMPIEVGTLNRKLYTQTYWGREKQEARPHFIHNLPTVCVYVCVWGGRELMKKRERLLLFLVFKHTPRKRVSRVSWSTPDF